MPRRADTVHVKIRLIKRGPKPTRAETEAVLLELANEGTVPDSWEFHALDWDTGKHVREGNENDIASFRSLILAQMANGNLKIATVRELP